jgi:hypothetical protein
MAETRTPEQIAYDEELARIQSMPVGVAKIKAQDAFDKKYPNGRPVSKIVSTDTESGAAEALAFGLTETLIAAFPELKPIYDLFVAKKYADARIAYYNSNYYKNLTSTSADRKKKKATQRGVYDQEFDAWKQATKVRLTSKGVKVTPEIEALLEGYYDEGYSDLQIDLKILDSGKLGVIGGSTLGLINQLKDTAYDQGVNNILNKNYWEKVSTGLFAGTLTVTDVEEELKNFAISAFPAYAKGIEAGRSFNLQTSALRQTIANLLEVDVDTVTNDNPVFKELVGYINPKTQTPEAVPLWEAEKIVKSKDQWLYTKNARQTFDDLGLRVLRDMGLA